MTTRKEREIHPPAGTLASSCWRKIDRRQFLTRSHDCGPQRSRESAPRRRSAPGRPSRRTAR